MIFDSMTIIAYAAGLILVYLLCLVFIRPLKRLFRAAVSGVLGGIMLAAVNLAGGFMGIQIAINPITALLSGILGIPGAVLIACLTYFLQLS